MLRDFTAGQIALALLGIGALIAWHELGHYLVARLAGMRVLRYSIGFGPKLFGFSRRGIDYQVALLPFGGFVQIFGMTPLEPGAREDPRSFVNASRGARAAVLLAGPGFNYLLAFALFFLFHVAWPGVLAKVTSVTPSSAAEAAGLVNGDLITQVGGRNLRTFAQLEERLFASDERGERENADRDAPGQISLQVARADAHGTSREVSLPLSLDARAKEPGTRSAVATPARSLDELGLGVALHELERQPLAALAKSLDLCIRNSTATLDALARLITGDPEVSASGPIGIVGQLKESAKRSAPDFVWLLAVLSVTLGLMNLLPLPSLDGIKVLVLAVEGIARRDVNPLLQLWVNALGLLVLLVLMAVLSVGDVRALFAG